MQAFPKIQTVLLALCCSLILTACSSSENKTITLDAEPTVNISLPDVLLNSSAINMKNIRPNIELSNGAILSLSNISGNNWTGVINVTAGQSYTATIVWQENYFGRPLPLTEMTQQLEVANDGTVKTISSTGYRTDIHSDSDSIPNLQERENGTNPFDANDSDFVERNNDRTNAKSAPADKSAKSIIMTLRAMSSDDADVIVPRIAVEDAPRVDGQNVSTDANGQLSGEWSAAVQIDSSGAPLSLESQQLSSDTSASADSVTHHWEALHDGTHLYIRVLANEDEHRFAEANTVLDQDDYEIRIDIASAGIDTDAPFGLQLQINDDNGAHVSRWPEITSYEGSEISLGTLKLE